MTITQVRASIDAAERDIDHRESDGPREHLLRELVGHAHWHLDAGVSPLECLDVIELVDRYPGGE